jgi:CO/xanthine dehydrogenase Mo-binding subunit
MSDPRVTGRQRYVIDVEADGMLHGRILRSPYPSARILSVDASMVPDGVVVLMPADVADLAPYGCQIADQHVLPQDRVRHVGDPVVAVAAESAAVAEEALQMIDVEYEELPAVFDAVSATMPDAPLVHDRHMVSKNDAAYFGIRPVEGSNVCHRFRLLHGDIEAGFREADVIVEETFTTASAAHVPMEPHAALALWEGGRLKVITGNQTPFNLRMDLARIFRMEPKEVQVVCPPMGGSFGAKTFVRIEAIVAALARKAGRPVRIILDRAEEFVTLNRHPSVIRMKIGAKRDGTLVAKEVHCLADTGAYADCGPGVAQKMGFAAPGPYRIPNVRVESLSVYTNLPPNGAYRGYGQMQSIWASERLMDILAGRLGMDPLQLRLKNLLREGDRYCTGEVMHDVAFEECLRDAAAAIGYVPGTPGLGLSVMMKGMQTPSFASVRVRELAVGRYHVECATVEMGQGSQRAIAVMAADLLGVAPGDVTVSIPDTDVVPPDTRTTSSRSTHMMGRAIAAAVANLKESGAGEGFGEIRENGGLDPDTGQGIASSHWHQGAAAARVSVDEETGSVTVEHIHASVYAGRVIVRKQAELQNEGSMIMGYGTAMFESLDILDGAVANPNLSDYNVPSIADLPRLTHSLIERETGDVHGLGETALPPVPAAIGNALQSLGLTLRDLPMTPERVLTAIDAAASTGREDAA